MSKAIILVIPLLLAACSIAQRVDESPEAWHLSGGQQHDNNIKQCESDLTGAMPKGTPTEKIKTACYDKLHYRGAFARACVERYKRERPKQYAEFTDYARSALPLWCALRSKKLSVGLDVDFYDRVTMEYVK